MFIWFKVLLILLMLVGVIYSCPSLVWSNREELISRPFLGENWFWWVLQKRMSTENAVGCLFCLSRSLCLQLQQNTMVPVEVDGHLVRFLTVVHKDLSSGNKSLWTKVRNLTIHNPHQQDPWWFVEVVNKVSVRDKTSSPQHSRCSYASGALIRIYFHPETAKK